MPNYTRVDGRNGLVELDKLQPELPVCTEEQKTQGASDCTPKDKVPDYSQFKLILPDDVRLLMAKYGWSVDDQYWFRGKGGFSEGIDLIYGATPSVKNDNKRIEFQLIDVSTVLYLCEEFDEDKFAVKLNLGNGTYEIMEAPAAYDHPQSSAGKMAQTPVISSPSIDTGKSVTDSTANAPHVVASVLKATEEFAGPNRQWTFNNPTGQAFASSLPELREQLPSLDKYIKSDAGLGPQGQKEVNQFLKENGFDIQLTGQMRPIDIAAASVLDIAVTWAEEGTAGEVTLEKSQKKVPGVFMDDIKTAYRVSGHNHPIVSVDTNDGVQVFMTRYDGRFSDSPTAISDWCLRMDQSLEHARREAIRGVSFPMVDYNEQGDIPWLINATSEDERGLTMWIMEAKFQNRLRMNEKGARAQAAVATAVGRGSGGPPWVKINGPFVVWFKTEEGIIPFSAYITEEAMKRPAGLE